MLFKIMEEYLIHTYRYSKQHRQQSCLGTQARAEEPVGLRGLELPPSEFVLEGVQHDLPRLGLVIPLLGSQLLAHFHLLLGGLALLALLFHLWLNYSFDDLVANESAPVDDVVEDGEAQELKVHSDLVCPTSRRKTLQQRRISDLIIPNLLEQCLAVLQVIILELLLDLFNGVLFFFFLLVDNRLFLVVDFLFWWFFLRMYFFSNPVDSIFMRNAFDVGQKLFLLPREKASNSGIVHLLHGLLPTFLMEQRYFSLVLGKDEDSAGAFVKTMQNMEIIVVVLILQQVLDGVEVVSSSCMHDDARRFIDHQVILGLVKDLDGQVKHRRLHSQGLVVDCIPVSENVVWRNLLAVDCDFACLQGQFIVLGGVGLELLGEGVQDGLSDPAALGESLEGVGVRLHKPKGELFKIDWANFLLPLLHLTAKQFLLNNSNPSKLDNQGTYSQADGEW